MMKKKEVKLFIFKALQKERNVPEVTKYIFENTGNRISDKTVYYHIKRVREDKERDYRLHQNGNRYKFVSGSVPSWWEEEFFIFLGKYIKNKPQYPTIADFIRVACVNQINNEKPYL